MLAGDFGTFSANVCQSLLMGSRHNKPLVWALIVALINLTLVMVPAGMVLAAPAAAHQPASTPVQQLSAVSPCHETMAAMPEQVSTEDSACANCHGSDHCPWCAQVATVLPLQAVELIPLSESFAETPGPRLAGLTHSLAPPPPRQLPN